METTESDEDYYPQLDYLKDTTLIEMRPFRKDVHKVEDFLYELISRESVMRCRSVGSQLVIYDSYSSSPKFVIGDAADEGSADEDAADNSVANKGAKFMLYTPDLLLINFKKGNYLMSRKLVSHNGVYRGDYYKLTRNSDLVATMFVQSGIMTFTLPQDVSPSTKALAIAYGIKYALTLPACVSLSCKQPAYKYQEALDEIYEYAFPLMENVVIRPVSKNEAEDGYTWVIMDVDNSYQVLLVVRSNTKKNKITAVDNLSGKRIFTITNCPEILDDNDTSVNVIERGVTVGTIKRNSGNDKLCIMNYKSPCRPIPTCPSMRADSHKHKPEIVNIVNLKHCEVARVWRIMVCNSHTNMVGLKMKRSLYSEEKKIIIAYLIKFMYMRMEPEDCTIPMMLLKRPICSPGSSAFGVPSDSLSEVLAEAHGTHVRAAGHSKALGIQYYDVIDSEKCRVQLTIECRRKAGPGGLGEAMVKNRLGKVQFVVTPLRDSNLLLVYSPNGDLLSYYHQGGFYDSTHTLRMTGEMQPLDGDKGKIAMKIIRNRESRVSKYFQFNTRLFIFPSEGCVSISTDVALHDTMKAIVIAFAMRLSYVEYKFHKQPMPEIDYKYINRRAIKQRHTG